MEINYENLKIEVISALDKNPVWVLSTSLNDYVTSRPMSIINDGLNVYFQTNKCYIKYKQIIGNEQISLCCQNISIQGIAKEIGNWNNPENAHLLELYKNKHLNSYEKYGMLNGQIVYKVTPTEIKLWKYVNGEPIRDIMFVNEQRAERLDFM